MTRSEEIRQVTKWRRDLHQIPELELHLPRTQEYILDQLKDLDCEISFPYESAVAVYFDAGQKDTIAFRSDMDALPVLEQTNHDFQSRNPGRMHACGHDGHMSNLLLFAHRLNSFYKELPHNVLLIFQPGEETPGGAQPICETGLLEDKHVKAIFGLHLWPLLDKGVIASRSGAMMARSSEIDLDITGKSVHTARWKEGIDALDTASRYLQAAYAMEQKLPENMFRVLRFGKMESGTVRNAVAGSARLEGTMRAFEDDQYDLIKNNLVKIAEDLEKETGANLSLHFSHGYPAVLNHEKLFDHIQPRIENLQLLDTPEMISEDFAWYQRYVPGIFFFLGTGTGIELHDPRFDFEEDLLLAGTDLFEQLARIDYSQFSA